MPTIQTPNGTIEMPYDPKQFLTLLAEIAQRYREIDRDPQDVADIQKVISQILAIAARQHKEADQAMGGMSPGQNLLRRMMGAGGPGGGAPMGGPPPGMPMGMPGASLP